MDITPHRTSHLTDRAATPRPRARRGVRPRWALLLVAGILALSGCRDTPDDGSATTPGSPPAVEDPSAASGTDRHWVSPLADYLQGAAPTRTTETSARARQERRQYEEALVACMAQEGFEYDPPSSGGQSSEGDGTEPWNVSSEAFAATYGYGITTIDRTDLGDVEDPNQERVEAMSPAQRTAYHRALWGDMVVVGDDGWPTTGRVQSGPDVQPDDRGCAGDAEDQVWQASAGQDGELGEYQPLLEDIQQLAIRIDNDPEVVAAVERWSTCMAEAGFPGYDSPDGPEADVQARLDELLAEVDAEEAPSGSPGDPRRGSLQDALPPAALEELRAHELDVATADHECSGDYLETRRQVQVEIEEQFISQHRERLDAYREALGSEGGES